jgi:hypothetical protein
MDARPQLERIARALAVAGLECILIGNAAAALQGAPVTTLDFDFFFRDTPTNRRKLVRFAKELGAIVLRPYYPASSMFRVTDDDLMLQADFLGAIHGVRSFEGARKRAATVQLDGGTLHVLSLEDILKSKRAANRRIARFCMFWRQRCVRAKRRRSDLRARTLRALRRATEHEIDEMIARLLAKPMHERTHFLRRRLPGGGSAL